MSKKKTYRITASNFSVIIQEVREMIHNGLAGGDVIVELGREKRSLDQNAKMWPMLTDISKQTVYHGMKFIPDEWKDICTAGFEEQKLVPGINGGFVAIGAKTSKYNKQKFSEFIEYLYWWGQENEVKWSDKSLAIYEQYGQYHANKHS
jgi:hypothetical protein